MAEVAILINSANLPEEIVAGIGLSDADAHRILLYAVANYSRVVNGVLDESPQTCLSGIAQELIKTLTERAESWERDIAAAAAAAQVQRIEFTEL